MAWKIHRVVQQPKNFGHITACRGPEDHEVSPVSSLPRDVQATQSFQDLIALPCTGNQWTLSERLDGE